jgi:hypothetical protein
MIALKATPAAQNLLAEPAPQTGQPGPVTLVIGSDFTGVNAPAAPRRAAGHAAGGADTGGQATVQSRNAGASICSGLPAANPDPGAPLSPLPRRFDSSVYPCDYTDVRR